MIELEVSGEEAQVALGAALGRACPGRAVIFLEGDLGAGKTTLARGFLHGRGHVGRVKSPTYTLIEPYQTPMGPCFHLDLYRLADPGELDYLGLRDLLETDSVLLVEWADRGEAALPSPDLVVRIGYRTESRQVLLEPRSAVGEGLLLRGDWKKY